MCKLAQEIAQFEEDISKCKQKLHVYKEIYKIQKNPEIAQKIAELEEKLAKLQKLLCLYKKLQEIEYTDTPEKQYEFATSFLKVGDYTTAERAFREFVNVNPEHDLAGNAQYWYAETFRIRQLYTDAASAYLEGYKNYPKSDKAPINLLKLGVSLVQIGEKDQGCLMISGVKKQYPNAKESVIQKAKCESKKFECSNQNS